MPETATVTGAAVPPSNTVACLRDRSSVARPCRVSRTLGRGGVTPTVCPDRSAYHLVSHQPPLARSARTAWSLRLPARVQYASWALTLVSSNIVIHWISWPGTDVSRRFAY